jgi:isopenicillin-N N-acyltransferase like protein
MKKILIFLALFFGFLLTGVIVFYFKVKIDPPILAEQDTVKILVEKKGEFDFLANNGSWLHKNDKGVWEMQLKGDALERGIAFGSLAENLQLEKEMAFVGEIQNRVPSPSYLNFLKYIVGWFNRDLDEYVPEEFLVEIYGASHYMSDRFDFISPKFHRALSYHGAHDIGHALQNMNLVGCTSFATWGNRSENNQLLIGRNFDFYFGKAFAKDPIIAFYKPTKGYQFMSVTWACFSGVVSGMNEKGLTITLNSAKSAIPSQGKTPVSLMARQILQYAANIDEAFAIAQSYESFVAETFLIGSKADGVAALIEKTPEKTVLYRENDGEMIMTNHFQSPDLQNDPLNQEYVAEEVSPYRHERVKELIDSLAPLSPSKAATILRDKNGLKGKDIGLGNEKAINQLLAHHSVIFSPENMMAWVSTPPYQLGDYLAYDLGEIFNGNQSHFTYSDSLNIPEDPFLQTADYQKFEEFVTLKERIQSYIMTGQGSPLTEAEIGAMISGNPNSYLTYYYLGDYFKNIGNFEKAAQYYEMGLTKEIAKISERKHIENALEEIKVEMQEGR